jgi:hypothetical protein
VRVLQHLVPSRRAAVLEVAVELVALLLGLPLLVHAAVAIATHVGIIVWHRSIPRDRR